MNYIYNSNNIEDHRSQYRKVQGLVGDQSFSIVLPKSYAIILGISKGDFVEVYQEEDKIIIKKA
jgi:AbrB family looped-hinge helix DNA binding protein